jgi:5-(carboxyamino)imidazole ribonucleotide synthase
LPPATIGILGSGQLGRMLALSARQMGYRVHVLSPGRDTPTGQVADREITADYLDLDAIAQFAQEVDVITYEFENVPSQTAVTAAQYAPLHPGPQALHVAQNRLREKQFFVKNGLPVAPFTAVYSLTDLQEGLEALGTYPPSSKPPPPATTAKDRKSSAIPVMPRPLLPRSTGSRLF